jgi:hypothetical protein
VSYPIPVVPNAHRIEAGTLYGPLVAGPEGVEILIVLRDSRMEAVGMKVPEEVVDATI